MNLNKVLLGIILFVMAGTILIYPSLPDTIPTHWNIYGEVDGYSPKWMALILGSIPFIMSLLFWILPKIDPNRQSFLKFSKAYERVKILLILFLIVMQVVTLAVSLGYEIPIDLVVKLGIAIIFIVMGNYLGQVKPNYTFGIRTPWTLASEEVWTKTHRVTSYWMVSCGLLMIITSFIAGMIGFILYFGCILIPTIFSIAYSFYLYQK